MSYKEILIEKNVKPSYIRLRVLEFLDKNRIHPTVDEIFDKLSDEIPTLSKTSIYNTVKLFEENDIVLGITIDDKQVRYDFDTGTHGHLQCDVCGSIFDVNESEDVPEYINGFKIRKKNVYYSGVCKKCLREQ